MDVAGIGRLLITFGIMVLLVGIVLVLVGKVPFLGRLPGDIVFHRDGFTLFIPIVTMIIVSLVLTVLLNLFFRIFR
jgi:ribose/xylose/arabinose/galactoside ABC-type transport system permease subunit